MSMEPGAITVRTVATLLLATWPRRLLLGGILLIPVIVAALGGFGAAEARSFDSQPGEPVDLGPLTITPTAYFVSAEVDRWELEYYQAEAWLGVIVEVENTTDEMIPLNFPGPATNALDPELPEGVLLSVTSTPPTVLRVADGSAGERALPGVPTEVAMLWPISDADAVGELLGATMTESLWTYGPMSGEEKWMSLGDTWHVQLPQVDLPPALFEPASEG